MKTSIFIAMYGLYHQQFGKLFPKSDPRHSIRLLSLCYNEPATQAELAHLIGISQGTVSKMAGVLVRKKLACWVRLKEGTKKSPALLELTSAGRIVLERFESELTGVLARRRGKSKKPDALLAAGQYRLKSL